MFVVLSLRDIAKADFFSKPKWGAQAVIGRHRPLQRLNCPDYAHAQKLEMTKHRIQVYSLVLQYDVFKVMIFLLMGSGASESATVR